MALIPQFVLRGLYKSGSLKQSKKGVEMTLENNLAFDLLVDFAPIEVDGEPHDPDDTEVTNGEQKMKGSDISPDNPFKLLTGKPIKITLKGLKLDGGSHAIAFFLEGKGAGSLEFKVSDEL